MPNVPDVLATPGAAPAALPMAGMEPETEFRPGRLLLAGLLACIGSLAWIMLLPFVDEDEDEVPQDAPMTLAAAARPDTGRDRPQRTPLAELSPAQRDRGILRLRERGRGDAHRQDGRRGGTPEQNSLVIHEALHFDVVIAENMTRLVKLTVKLRRAIRRESDACGRTERPVCAPDTVTQL